jgi:hypothetical protein
MMIRNAAAENIIEKSQELSRQKCSLGIGRLMSRLNDNHLCEKVNGIIANELIAVLGKDFVFELDKDRNGRRANMVLTDAIGKIGKELIISIKIVDIEKSKILFANNAVVADENDIPDKAVEISADIAGFFNQNFIC